MLQKNKIFSFILIVVSVFSLSFFLSACDTTNQDEEEVAQTENDATDNRTDQSDDTSNDRSDDTGNDASNNTGTEANIDVNNPAIKTLIETDIYDIAAAYDDEVNENSNSLDMANYTEEYDLTVNAEKNGMPTNVTIIIRDISCTPGGSLNDADQALNFVGVTSSSVGDPDQEEDVLFYDYEGYNLSVQCDVGTESYRVGLVKPVEFAY
jgi:hypothetical protein